MNKTRSLKDALRESPLLFPLDMDAKGENVQFVRMLQADYAAASFLDQRMLRPGQTVAAIAWPEVLSAANELPLRCDFIFHISHVGSTLLSRLLGQHPALLSLREPAILRRLAMGEFPERLDVFLGLWSRTFAPQQKAIIKATSFVSSISAELLERVTDSRALLMYVPARTFIAAMLDGVMSDIDELAPSRWSRLQRQHVDLLELPLTSLTAGERVAMSWLTEMLSLQQAAARFPDRTMWLDFDNFLLDVERQLAAALRHFHVSDNCHNLLAGTTMERYAKRPDVKYDADLRRRLLSQAHAAHATEIERGLSWLRKRATLGELPP